MAAPIQTIFSTVPLETRCLFASVVGATSVLLLLRSSLTADDLKAVFGAGQDSLLVFPWIIAVPGYVLWRPWTLLTAPFVESNIIEMIFSATTLLLAGRYLQRFWKPVEYLKFVAVVTVGSNVIAVIVSIVEHIALRGAGQFLYGQAFHGLTALQVGFLVAFTQLIPEHQVQLLGGLLKLKVKQLPMLYVTFSNVMCLIGYQCPYILIQFGWLLSWVYLRFYKEGGDRSETFAFASWFPPFVQPYVARISNIVFPIAVKLHLISPWHDIETGLGSTPGNARAEAERRRAMALQALDQRLASSTNKAPGAPSPRRSASASGMPPQASSSQAEEPSGEVVFDAEKEADTPAAASAAAPSSVSPQRSASLGAPATSSSGPEVAEK